jgi:hypothetical protein
MTRTASTFKKADLKRALDAATAAGLPVDSYRVLPDGEIFVKIRHGNDSDAPAETPEKVLGLV